MNRHICLFHVAPQPESVKPFESDETFLVHDARSLLQILANLAFTPPLAVNISFLILVPEEHKMLRILHGMRPPPCHSLFVLVPPPPTPNSAGEGSRGRWRR